MAGEPGHAEVRRYYDTGVLAVVYADPVIRVSVSRLDMMDAPQWDGKTLVLDTTALYRYQFLCEDIANDAWVFERIGGD